ncbi:MAG: MBL fold metallo-hydrolase, partial [Bryobacterales bacterium]|nr:MBL fold metallo-hydrolase [Bryobacterales bacterium]
MASRRTLLAGLGAAAAAGAGAFAAYRVSPAFWRQYLSDLRREIGPPPARPDLSHWDRPGVHAAWLGHSTVLLRIDGYTVITDPMFSARAGLDLGFLTLGVKRLIAAALTADLLPPVDLILLSHAHMDHFDLPSLRALEHAGTQVITAPSTMDLLPRPERYGRGVRELRWGQSAQAGPLTVRAIEVNHWGARLRTDTYRGYNGYVIETARR